MTGWTAPSKGTGGVNVNCIKHSGLVRRCRFGSSSNRGFKQDYLKDRQLAQAIVSSGSLECAHSQSEQIEQDACVSCTRKVWRKVEFILYKQGVSWCENGRRGTERDQVIYPLVYGSTTLSSIHEAITDAPE